MKKVIFDYLLKIFLVINLIITSSCIHKSYIEVKAIPSKNKSSDRTLADVPVVDGVVSNVSIVNDQLVINGNNLDQYTDVKVKEGGIATTLDIVSKTSSSIIANTLSNVTFAAGKMFELVLSSANAAAVFQINFSLCDSSLNGKDFDCTLTPNDKDVLSFDATSNKWIPRNVNGLSYKGTYNAGTAVDPGGSPANGDYYVISGAGTINSISYVNGDWIVYNGDDLAWQKVSNSKDVLSVFGRTGNISAKKGDYDLNKLSDLDLTTTPPQNGNLLMYNGTKWVPSTGATNATMGNGKVTGSMTFTSTTAPAGALTEGKIYFDSTANKFKVSENNGSFVDLISTTAISGSGTLNYVPRFTASGTIGNSAIVDNGTVITATRAIASTTNPIASGASINLATSNSHTLASVGGATITVSGMTDGGVYNIVIEDTTSRTYTFSGCTTSYFKPVNGATTAATRSIYGLMTVKKGANWDCYITWSTGFQ